MGWIQILLAIISYFSAKKKGASDVQAAIVAGGAYMLSDYVVKNTDFGRNSLQGFNTTIDGWLGIGSGDVAADGTVTDSAGQPVTVPAGHAAVKQPDGSIVFVPQTSGNGVSSFIDATGKVLTSWGAAGTAGVVLASSSSFRDTLEKYLPWALGAFFVWKLAS